MFLKNVSRSQQQKILTILKLDCIWFRIIEWKLNDGNTPFFLSIWYFVMELLKKIQYQNRNKGVFSLWSIILCKDIFEYILFLLRNIVTSYVLLIAVIFKQTLQQLNDMKLNIFIPVFSVVFVSLATMESYQHQHLKKILH